MKKRFAHVAARTLRLGLSLSVTTTLIMAYGPSPEARASFPGKSGTVYFTQYTGNSMDLYSTEDPAHPTWRALDFWEAAVSPDGSRIVAVGYGTHGGLYLMGPDGSNPTPVDL